MQLGEKLQHRIFFFDVFIYQIQSLIEISSESSFYKVKIVVSIRILKYKAFETLKFSYLN